MRVEWFGQSAFSLTDGEQTVFIDPFGDMSSLAGRGMRFDYPPIAAAGVDLILVTHEHRDHNGVEAIAGEPALLRSTAGKLESSLGEVTAIASEHDEAAGTKRGPNTIFVFTLGGVRVAHFGDFGQAALRPEQAEAIGEIDLLIVPVGGGPTIGGTAAAELTLSLRPTWVVPMHYRTHRVDFLEPADEFLAAFSQVRQLDSPSFETVDLPQAETPLAVVPAVP
ncbi:MAG TPA: MBL fold metallo-hydrolase [Solirubrobacterales bacterium]|jgi:L-ascorbate metabolism protein UlaG (beta-lactamase superfamily)|nr:MBL fold metallo-hydrolase [Solirubrobacterales bacterium]